MLGIVLRRRATRPFPTYWDGMLVRPVYFAPGRTFAIYVAHPERACDLIGVELKRRTRAVLIVRRGLSEAGGSPFSPNPDITSRRLTLKASQKRLRDDLALIALLGRTFSRRV